MVSTLLELIIACVCLRGDGVTPLSLVYSVGTRLGIFDALAKLAQSKKDAVTTSQLADSLKYKERSVVSNSTFQCVSCGSYQHLDWMLYKGVFTL